MNPKKANDKRKRIELCDWEGNLHATALDKGSHYSAKAKCRGRLTETEIAAQAELDPSDVERLLVAVGKAVRAGYEVRLCEAVRFYACVLKLKTPFIATQTIGNFRRSIADKTIRPVLHGKSVSMRRVVELDREARKSHPHITPDTTITCNVCGNVMRVGKVLG